MLTAAERSRNYEKSMREKGFRKVHLWVPESRADELARVAEGMRRKEETELLRNFVLSTLRSMENKLRKHGIVHLALFGSVARDDAGPDSDVDLVANLDVEKKLTILDLISIEAMIAEELGRNVDLVSRQGLNSRFRDSLSADEIPVF